MCCACNAGALVVMAIFAALVSAPVAAADSFPFNEELLLDIGRCGSKRIPVLDIKADGAVLIDLWCNSVHAHMVIAAIHSLC